MSVAKHIDHTNLKMTATSNDIVALCEAAHSYGFRAVCVNTVNLSSAVACLAGSVVRVATVIDFPLGASDLGTKLKEVEFARKQRADEIDVVWNLGAFKNKEFFRVLHELRQIVNVAEHMTVKVIVESHYLDGDECINAFSIVSDSGAQYIKTSTGFVGGQQYIAVRLWQECRQLQRNDLKIKASGGIRNYVDSVHFLEAGADVIGTSSGVQIIKEERDHE